MGRDDEISEEEKARRGMAFLQMLASMSQAKNSRQKNDEAELELAKVEKRFYDAYIKVGFTAEQAIELTKNKMNIFINKFMPDDDKTDPRFK